MQLTCHTLWRVDQAETSDSFTEFFAFANICYGVKSSQIGVKGSALISVLVVESKGTGSASEMCVFHIICFNLLYDVCGSNICRVCIKDVAASTVDKDVLVAGEVVEPVGTGEENSWLADVKLELVVPKLVAACQWLLCVFSHSWGSEERRIHLCRIQRFHHLVRVDQAVVAAWLGGGDPRDRRSSAVATSCVAQSSTFLHGQPRVINFSRTPKPEMRFWKSGCSLKIKYLDGSGLPMSVQARNFLPLWMKGKTHLAGKTSPESVRH